MSALNVGNIDRVLRILLGILLVALAARETIGVWGYAGIVLILTGIAARCPLYSLFDIRTTSR
ncbi:MAG: DUF2892 domain-containing protein [Burkholderiales bacterium]|jgi:drug/metabolite transporter (DMT)-like permease|nr:DUF2892 domain-containing protein [Burkholderiales bacterium]